MADTYTIAPKLSDIEFILPDVGMIADTAVREGLNYCVRMLSLSGSEAVAIRVRERDRVAWTYYEYGLARYLAEQLAELDEEVQAVYLFDVEATPDDQIFGDVPPDMVHLLIHAHRRTNALDSLVSSLEQAVTASYVHYMSTPDVAYALDVQIVDDADIAHGACYAAMLTSVHHRPHPLWKRQ
jgi:hypothetical protein